MALPSRLLIPIALALAEGCAPQPQAIAFRSLESSGSASFICLSRRDTDTRFTGTRYVKDCPDNDPVDGEFRNTFALVTQRNRGEVAVIAVNAQDSTSGKIVSGAVIDEEPSVPGYNFLPVGAIPVDITSTPGSAATFVATAEVGKEGIYVIPSSCVQTRDPARADAVRDITLWPACHLPSAPGRITVLIDPPAADGSIRTSCAVAKPTLPDGGAFADGGSIKVLPDAATTAAQVGLDCPSRARIETEEGPPGRRKLAVTLPDLGEIAIIDAQTLANVPPGSFGTCPIEHRAALKAQLPTGPIIQRLPPDLDSVYPEGLPHPPPKTNVDSRPAGIARLDDSNQHELFVADSEVPAIHVLDTSDPCVLTELPPLLPVSYSNPNRIVTTTKLAVMDKLTVDGGKRFLYAIDQIANGQVMMFDVSPDSTERTPIVRPRSAYTPFEPDPDRLAISAPAVDVAFVTENPARSPDPATGTETLVKCDPTPGSESAGTKYRPSIPDYSTGASPAELRGTFGLVALSSGHISIIDVEDLDEPCRRPLLPNPGPPPVPGTVPPEDFRGCVGDGTAVPFTKDGTNVLGSVPTVTTEATCQVIEQHRVRSGSLILTDGNRGIHAPAIRVAPKLVDKDSRGLVTDDTIQGRANPKMLGANFANFSAKNPQNRAQVFIGTDFFETAVSVPTGDGGASVSEPPNELVIDPAKAQKNSLVLSLSEPRAYGGDENFTATYEGKLFVDQPAGVFKYDPERQFSPPDPTRATLRDTALPIGNGFCGAGVESMDITRHRFVVSREDSSKELGITDEAAFIEEYADYVEITSDLLLDTDPYWSGNGAKCLGATQPGAGRVECSVTFGTTDAPTDNRKLSIVSATRDTLTVKPKGQHSADQAAGILSALACCFPEPVSYHVRVSKEWLVKGNGIDHDIVPSAPNFTCVNDPSPLKQFLNSRAFEVSCDKNSPDCLQKDPKNPTQPGRAIIGPDSYTPPKNATDQSPILPTRVCVIKNPSTDLQTIGAGVHPGCIFTSLKSNFVVYRGTEQSQVDMSFQWQVSGGFSPLLINLSVGSDPNTSPQSLVSSPFPETIMVADGGDKGLVVVDLSSFNAYPIY